MDVDEALDNITRAVDDLYVQDGKMEALDNITRAVDDLYVQDGKMELETYKSFIHIVEDQKRG